MKIDERFWFVRFYEYSRRKELYECKVDGGLGNALVPESQMKCGGLL